MLGENADRRERVEKWDSVYKKNLISLRAREHPVDASIWGFPWVSRG